jgi:hypothetical protein
MTGCKVQVKISQITGWLRRKKKKCEKVSIHPKSHLLDFKEWSALEKSQGRTTASNKLAATVVGIPQDASSRSASAANPSIAWRVHCTDGVRPGGVMPGALTVTH